MKKIYPIYLKYLLFSVAAFIVLLAANYLIRNLFKPNSDETIASIELPINSVDSSVIFESDDVINGRHVIIIRLIDKRKKEYYFAILNDGHGGKYHTVLKNLPIIWSEEYGYKGIVDPLHKSYTPSVFFYNGHFDRAIPEREAMCDLVNILKNHRNSKGGRNNLAYKLLSEN